MAGQRWTHRVITCTFSLLIKASEEFKAFKREEDNIKLTEKLTENLNAIIVSEAL